MARKLRILHCLRTPVGGLFRHVCDLARAQAAHGHDVGVICDASTGGETADRALAALAPDLKLGLQRVAMARQIGVADYPAYAATLAMAEAAAVDIVHGHGAKGGAYGRLAARALKAKGRPVAAFYTPHGGSLHYEPGTMEGMIFLGLERMLAAMTDGLIFESAYSADVFSRKIAPIRQAHRVVPNGLLPDEFVRHEPSADAVDFLFVGELRRLKGVDLLLEALARLKASRPVSAHIVGAGPDGLQFQQQAAALGLGGTVDFLGVLPARQAFPGGHCLVVPSRVESFPYIVLEAAAAGIPLIATRVGGIPEITSGSWTKLIAPDDVSALVERMDQFLDTPQLFHEAAGELHQSVADRFTVNRMAESILAFYEDRLLVRA